MKNKKCHRRNLKVKHRDERCKMWNREYNIDNTEEVNDAHLHT